MTTPINICSQIPCSVLRAEADFFYRAHCLLDGKPGIGTSMGLLNEPPSEMHRLGRHKVSNSLWQNYSTVTPWFKKLEDETFDGNSFQQDVLKRNLFSTFCETQIIWSKFFYSLLTNNECPVKFLNITSSTMENNSNIPPLYVHRNYVFGPSTLIVIGFLSTTSIDVPSRKSDALISYLKESLELIGINLPYGINIEQIFIERQGLYKYIITIPLGPCNVSPYIQIS